MIAIIFILVWFVNLFNMQNHVSRGIVYFGVIAIIINVVVFIIGKKINKSFLRYIVNDIKKNKIIILCELVIMFLIISRQYVYDEYKDLSIQFKECFLQTENAEDWDNSMDQFIAHNSVFMPKCIKRFFVILGEAEYATDEYRNDIEGLQGWADENMDRLRAQAAESENEMQELSLYLTALLMLIVLQKTSWLIRELFKDIKSFIKRKRRTT